MMLPYLITLAVLAGVVTLLGLAGQALRRHRGAAAAAGGMLAAYEEAVRGTSYAAHAELLAEANRMAPIEVPGGRFEGRTLLADGAARAFRARRGMWRTVRTWWQRG